MYRNSDRIDIENELLANFADVRHWAFTFALDNPVLHTEEVGAVICCKRKADGGDYADTPARCDYATVNHFADLSDGRAGRGVTISKHLETPLESLSLQDASLEVAVGARRMESYGLQPRKP